MKYCAFLVLVLSGIFAFMAGCSGGSAGCGNPPSYSGTSVGCENPPKVADLFPTPVNGCEPECGGGVYGPARYLISLGKTLNLHFYYPRDTVSPLIRIYVYSSDQVPVFRKAPLDSFELTSLDGFILTPSELEKAIREADQASATEGLFTFNLHIRLWPDHSRPGMIEDGLMAGLGLDTRRGVFISAENPSWGRDSSDLLKASIHFFQGKIVSDTLDSGLASASAAFVYVPGSPYSAFLNLQDSLFRMDKLPYASFELRLAVIPSVLPDSRKIPTYRIYSDSSALPDRKFQLIGNADSVIVPPGFP